MGRDGLLIGEVAKRSGVSRKALRVYEEAEILPAPRRTPSGYRIYGSETLALLAFVRQARRLGFRLDEIKEIVAIKRAGRAPCPHVRDLVRRKAEELDRTLSDLMQVRDGLRGLLNNWRSARQGAAAVCTSNAPAALRCRKQQGGEEMDSLKMSLCPECSACPEVEIAGDEVRIGEAGNLAVLKRTEWNVLVDLIQSGQLTKV